MVHSVQGTQPIQMNGSNVNINNYNDDNNTLKSRTNNRTMQTKYYLGRRVRKNQVKLFGNEILIYALSLDLSFKVLPGIKHEGSE